MKKVYLLLSSLFLYGMSQAQPVVSIASGTDMYIPAGTIIHMEGLSLTPSAGFTFNGISLSKGSVLSHTSENTYVTRTYLFSANTNPFTGTIGLTYKDPELNGLNESLLEINFFDGTTWQHITSTGNNAVTNQVQSASVSAMVLNELTLASSFAPLPLTWGAVSAYRQAKSVKTEWSTLMENNVSYFTVQRSEDGHNWTSLANINATNTTVKKYYSAIDNSYLPTRIYYRIQQTDVDGKISYSPIAPVAAINEANTVILYPNPVTTGFSLANVATGDIKNINLYNNAGALVKSWPAAVTFYSMQGMPAGIYRLAVRTQSGYQYISLNKK